MRSGLITVGVPVYRGETFVADTLRSIQAQTWTNLEVLISIDGGDTSSFEACRPFLADPRFTITQRGVRLDWAGNLNWLIAHAAGEYFCYQQQDDLIEPDYLEKLSQALISNPAAAIAYSDVKWFGLHSGQDVNPPLMGGAVERVLTHLEHLVWIPTRGLIRRSMLERSGGLRVTEFRSAVEELVWLAKLARLGPFLRVPEPLYSKRYHEGAIHGQWHQWEPGRRMNAWTVCFSGLVAAMVPAGKTPREREALFAAIIRRFLVNPQGRWALFDARDLSIDQRRDLAEHLLERIAAEGEIDLKVWVGAGYRAIIDSVLAEVQVTDSVAAGRAS